MFVTYVYTINAILFRTMESEPFRARGGGLKDDNAITRVCEYGHHSYLVLHLHGVGKMSCEASCDVSRRLCVYSVLALFTKRVMFCSNWEYVSICSPFPRPR